MLAVSFYVRPPGTHSKRQTAFTSCLPKCKKTIELKIFPYNTVVNTIQPFS